MATTTELPKTMRALTMSNWPFTGRIFNLLRHWSLASIGKGLATVQEVPLPTLKPSQVLVRVHAIALNPTDWKHMDFLAPARARMGCDYMGVVAALPTSSAPDANPHGLKIGDRVGGSVHGGQYTNQGSFAEYLAIDAALLWKVGDAMSDEDAASMGVSALTAMLTLNLTLGVPWADEGKAEAVPEKDRPTILIYSGATTAGLLCIQVARLGGYRPIVTCSPRSDALVRRYGAADTFDYRSPEAVAKIKAAYPDTRLAIDCWSEGASTEFCANVVRKATTGNAKTESAAEPTVAILLPQIKKFPGVKVENIMAYTLMGEPFQMLAPIGPKYKAFPEHRAGAVRFAGILPDLIAQGKIKAPPVGLAEGGLDAVLENLDRLRRNAVSGEKVVLRLK